MDSLPHPHLDALLVLTTVLTGAVYWVMHAVGIDRVGGGRPAKLNLAAVLLVWFAVIALLVRANWFPPGQADIGIPHLPLVLAVPILLGIAALWRPGMRAVVDAIPLAWLSGFHGLRFVFGIFFLARYELGLFPPEFAFRGGYGDIAAGILGGLAACLIVLGVSASAARMGLLVFSVVGLLDFAVVIYTGITVLPGFPVHLPINAFLFVPGFVVPQFIITHIYVLRAVLRQWRGTA